MLVAIYKEKTSYQTKAAKLHKYESDGSYHIELITISRATELPESYNTFEEAEAEVNKMFKCMGTERVF